jgi:sugar phosphate isomerase/epimerase
MTATLVDPEPRVQQAAPKRGMQVGVDGSKLPAGVSGGPLAALDQAHALGLDGVFFRTVLDLSPTLDVGVLREVRAHADRLGLYMQMGLAKVNPYAAPEAPEVRALGDGDTRLGMERMMRACHAVGCVELWVALANWKPQLPGYFAYDRFRTDAPWADQLAATEKFLKVLAPIARDLGIHLNLETHEEITTFEAVRLVEAVGPDTIGITFDTANVLVRAEDPLKAAARVAPYTRMSHIRDVALYFTSDGRGLGRLLAPCGEGVINWRRLLAILAEHQPDLQLSIESPLRMWGDMSIQIYDPFWQAAHPDLTVSELAEVVRLTRIYEQRAQNGEVPSAAAISATPLDLEQQLGFIQRTAAYLRQTLASLHAEVDA